MIRIEIRLIWPGCAEGSYTLKAKGYILAVLNWGDALAPLPGWGPFAYVPIDPAGNGSFFFSGQRGVPRGATHVWARCYGPDFASYEDASAGIPESFTAEEGAGGQRFSLLTDLHLSAKPWRVRQALGAAESDTVLLLEDLTNDGLP